MTGRSGPHKWIQEHGDRDDFGIRGSQMIQQMAGDDYQLIKLAVMAR